MSAARAEAGVPGDGRVREAAAELDRVAGRLVAASAELHAARTSASSAASEHQAEIERLHAEIVDARAALVLVQESVSWRLTRPVRAVGRLLRRSRR